MPLGFNDDVSAISISPEKWIIIKTDMLVGSTDVPPGMTMYEAARKAVVATISDFAAKGVRPLALMASIGLPAPARKTTVQSLGRGLDQAAREYNCKIIGGDTNHADDVVIDIAGLGIADPKRLVQRNGARPGDIVAVTGPFGKSAAGMKILMSERRRHVEKFRSLANAVRLPKAQLAIGMALARIGGATSSIDSSDGLAMSLHQIAQASNVGISLDRIPTAREVEEFAREYRLSAIDLALYGGEEYELVLTVRPERFRVLKRRIRTLLEIGIVKPADQGLTATVKGRHFEIEERGWEHFT